MQILKTIGAVILGIVAAVVAYRLITDRPAEIAQPPTPAESAPAPIPADPAAKPAISGDYADDWQKRCGPITDSAQQKSCTDKLDAAYGHKEDAPVPKN